MDGLLPAVVGPLQLGHSMGHGMGHRVAQVKKAGVLAGLLGGVVQAAAAEQSGQVPDPLVGGPEVLQTVGTCVCPGLGAV